MKKILGVFLFSVLIIGLRAQDEQKLLRFGMNGNFGYSWMKTDRDSLKNLGGRLGFGYGFITEVTLAKNFSVATGFDVLYQGGKIQKEGIYVVIPPDTNKVLGKQVTKYRLQYLDIPVTLKMKTNEINYITYFLRIGGSAGVCLQAKADRTYENIPGTSHYTKENLNIKDERSLFRVNFIVAGGIEYSLGGTTAALAELSFTNGLTYLIHDKAKGNYLQLKFGVLF